MSFKRVRNLTLDILKFVENEPRYVKITGPIHLGKEQKAGKGDEEKKRDPAHLAHCINLEDGSECQIIVSAVVMSVLDDEYPTETYVGKCFAITKKNRVPGKQYFPYSVEEIEDPTKSDHQISPDTQRVAEPEKVAQHPAGKKRA